MRIFGWLLVILISVNNTAAAAPRAEKIDPQDLIEGPLKRFIDPAQFGVSEFRLDHLAREGSLVGEKIYGYQWYTLAGGLLFRGFTQGASPAKKLDEILGISGSDQSVVRFYRRRIGNLLFPWTGLCNSVANLHLTLDLPDHAVLVSAKEGGSVLLEPEDLHAIVAHALEPMVSQAPVMGLRCDQWLGRKRVCQGLNPGSFHLMLSEFLGHRHESFVIDSDRFRPVNNIPVYSYQSTIGVGVAVSDRDGQPVKVYPVRTVVELPVEVSLWSKGVVTHETRFQIYQYELYVDPKDEKILGGRWISRGRPDFAWRPICRKFTGDMEWLNSLITWRCDLKGDSS